MMQARKWETILAAGLLTVCLVVGLVLGFWLAPKPEIGLLRFEGAIDIRSAEQLVTILENVRQDDNVAAVVLELASPGGLATSSESIYYTMLKLREEKPLVVVVDGMAVSGGYYMASAGNRIYAPASSYIGNVGARGPKPDDPTLAPEEISSGPYKLSGGSRFDRVRQLDQVKRAFVDNVVYQRQHAELNPLQIDADTVAEARIYLGSEAVALGMIDAEGGRSDAIAAAAKLAKLRRYNVVDVEDDLNTGRMIQPDYRATIEEMAASAPPDAVFLLDSRIPLPNERIDSSVIKHLLHLRKISPSSLDSIPLQKVESEAVEDMPEISQAVTNGEGS